MKVHYEKGEVFFGLTFSLFNWYSTETFMSIYFLTMSYVLCKSGQSHVDFLLSLIYSSSVAPGLQHMRSFKYIDPFSFLFILTPEGETTPPVS